MAEKTGRSEEKTDFFGDSYTEHYDANGQRIGRSEERVGIFGNAYTQHYDESGREIGTSENKEGGHIQHYDAYGTPTTRSKDTSDIFGKRFTQHYDEFGSKSGTSSHKWSIFGQGYVQHYGDGGLPSARRSSLSRNGSYSDVGAIDSQRGKWSVLGYLYFSVCGGAWILYLAVVVLGGAGIMPRSSLDAIDGWLSHIVRTPTGVALISVFGVGIVFTGIAVIVIVLALVPVILLISLLLSLPDIGPLLALVIGGPITVLYSSWVFRKLMS